VPRSEIFITSKLFEIHHHPEHVELAIKDTLNKLKTDYLDLYLMHWNVSGAKIQLSAFISDAQKHGRLSFGNVA
jgi:diketogulonate reductase-like aldo/keto reductase